MILDYTTDFINRYYQHLKDANTCEDAYNATEKDYYQQYKTYIQEGRMKDSKFKNFNSFKSSLYHHITTKR